MLNTRWKKILRDVQKTPGRTVLMLVAIAFGVFGFTTLLSSYDLLNREMRANYLATNPASASLQIKNIDSRLLASARQFPGIAHAQASATVKAALRSADGELHPLTIFVIENFAQLHINTFFANQGSWPPAPNTLLLEQSSLQRLKTSIGDKLVLHWGDGLTGDAVISGSVRDPGVPVPSMSIFAYATPDTLKPLGIIAPLTELKISVSDPLSGKPLDKPSDINAIENTASQLAHFLQQQGYKVSSIRIPPPGEHPHQQMIFSILIVFLLFSGISLILSAILTATIVDGLMARQVRQIGVMKTIGGSNVQIAGLYFAFIFILCALATAIAITLGLAAGRAFSTMILANLNFTLKNPAVSVEIYWLIIASSILLPLLMTAIPIVKWTRSTPQIALTDTGTAQHYFSTTFSSRTLTKIPGLNRTLIMSMRNIFRRRGRLMLLLTLLSSAGAMFIGGLNLKYAAEQHLIAAATERHYDLEVILHQATDQQKIRTLIQSLNGVERVEAWASTTIARHRPDGLNIERTYSDSSHGALYLTAIPSGSNLLTVNMHSGQWLANTNETENALVLNRRALESFPQANIGDNITLGVADNARTFRLIGIAEQKMTGAMAYISTANYRAMTGQDERYRNYRVVTTQHDAAFIESMAKKIEVTLAEHHIKVNYTLTETRLRYEIDGHFTMLVNTLFFIAALMAVVAIFALASVMGTNILERIREFGIMRSIGASSAVIIRNVIAESVFISTLSWVMAIVLSIPLSVATGIVFGEIVFGEAFPLAISPTALWIWLLMVTTGAILASVFPARTATSISIREGFAQ